MNSRRQLWLSAIILLGISGFSQTNPNTDQGLKPYESLHGGAIDSVVLTSGNLFVHHTLYATPQRGRVGLTFSLQYNNKGFRLNTVCPPPGGPRPTSQCTYTWRWQGNGATLIPDQSLNVTSQHVDTGYNDGAWGNGTGNEIWTYIYSATSSDGSVHQLADTGNGYRSIDASGILANVSTLAIQDRSGMYAGGEEDPNGNFFSIDGSNNYVDTLGRTIPPLPGPTLPTQTPPASTASLTSCPNLNLTYQPVTNAYTWNPPGPTGTSPFILCFASVYIRTAMWGMGYQNSTYFHDVSRSFTLLQSVVQPDGTAWTFTYDGANPSDTTSLGYGDLLKIGFPVGGSISYTYQTLDAYAGGYYEDNIQTLSRSVVTRSVNANDGTGAHTSTYTWGNVITGASSNYVVENTVTDPLGNDTVHQVTGFFGGPSLFETQTRYYQGSQSSGTLLKTVNTDYSYSSNPFDHIGANVNPPTAINVVPIRVTTILPNGLVTKEETDHDSAFTFRDPFWGLPIYPPLSYTSATYSGTLGTVSARREYDYGAGSAGNLLRQTFTTYLWQGNSNYLTANMLDLPSSVVVKDGNGNRVAETDSTYDEAQYLSSSGISTQHQSAPNAVRGNLTTVSKWLSTSTNPVVTHTNWYDTGEVFQTIDALGNATTHSYDPAYVGAYSTKTCNSLSQCVSGTYDFNSGALTSFTDQNAASQASGTTQGDPAHTSNYGYDNMFRMTQALLPPDANAVRPETDFYYPNSTTVQRCRKQLDNAGSACGSGWIVDYAYFDGLGRTTQTRLADPAGDDYVDTTYDTLGRVSTVSNPHRNNSTNSTDGITTSHYDALSRVTSITKQDGSASSVQYDQAVGTANCTIATDEAGKQRKTCSDGLGRLMKVWEDPAGLSYETDYQYDALGNLLRVDQKGSAPGDSTQWRTRLFTYDSLSQLLSAQNPESGTITYQYDNAGNMIYKGDPRGSHITYAYDQLHRLILKTPSDGTTPIVNYTYDQTSVWGHTLTNGIGRMTSESVFTNWGQPYIQAALFGYDALGHMTNEWDCLPSTCPSSITYPISAAYNPAGEMTSLTYPDGQVINYSYDVAAHALSAIGADNTNYVYNATYYPNGAQYRQWWTPNIYARTDLNNRLQVAAFYSDNGVTPAYYLSKTYSYGAQNNGNVLAIYNNKDSSRTQSFTYDSLNRLTHAETSGTDCTQTLPDGHTEYWGNNYVYDAWGNLYQKNVTKCSAENLQVSVTAQNRLTGYSYDAAGNMTGDGIHTATYDAENRLTQVSSGIASYLYDSEGNRVSKNAGGISTEYVYFGGNAIAERNPSAGNWTDYIFFNGKRVARRDPSGAVHYYLSDHLGSTTMVVNAAGTIENESDYYPWGGELKISAADSGNHYKFTGKERDAETGLDYFGARYYSNGMGRWLSPDWAEKPEAVPYAELGDPQSLNLYGYVRNLPTTRHDADGHLQQDQNGNIKFRKTGEATVTFIDEKVSPGSDINIQIKWSADIGYVKADDGTKIKASKATGEMKVTLTDGDGLTLKSGGSELLPPGFSNTADCHGTTFAKGQVWIDNDQTSKIIKGDHYQPTGSPQTDDVGVYTRNGNLKETVHSVRVTGTDTSGQVSSVSSKGGITPKMETTPGPGPGTAWRDPSVKLTYYTQHVEP